MIDLRKGDCLELMKDLPDKSIDAIICDLPYGTTACKWDSIIPFEPLWAQYKRIIKDNGAIVLFGSEPFSTKLRMSNFDCYKYDWIWDKHIPRGMHIAKVRPMQKHENISVFTSKGETPNYYPIMTLRDKPVKVKNYGKSKSSPLANNDGNYRIYTHKGPDSILVGYWEANKGKIHPTQKPVALMEYLVRTYTNEGETVLDNCIGSGSTGVACINTNRRFIGMELDDKYFEIAKARINEATTAKQLRLF